MDADDFVKATFVEFPYLVEPLIEFAFGLGAQIPESGEDIDELLETSASQYSPTYLLYQTMFILKKYTQEGIDQGDRHQVRRYFKFIDGALMAGNSDVENAIAVSYFEALNFMDQKRNRSWASKELPKRSADLAITFHRDLSPK